MSVQIPFNQIKFHPQIRNSREELRNIPELANSIVAVGLENPLHVLEIEEEVDGQKVTNTYLYVGFRRHAAIALIRTKEPKAFQTVEVKKLHGTLADAMVRNLTENLQRDDLSSWEISGAVVHLSDELQLTQRVIATKLGKSQSWVSNILTFHQRATVELKEAVRTQLISFKIGQHLAGLEPDSQRQQVREVTGADQSAPTASAAAADLPAASDPTTDLPPAEKPRKTRAAQSAVRKKIREGTTATIKPGVTEIRAEISARSSDQLSDFDRGVLVALQWVLGECKTITPSEAEISAHHA